MIRTAFIFLSLAAVASAEPPKVRFYEAVVVDPLPAATKHMTRGEFARWARQENQESFAESLARNDAIKSGRPVPKERRAIVSESSSTTKRRFGGGVGYEGFGGNGGYAGYNNQGSGNGGLGGGGIFAGMYGGAGPIYNYNYGYGFNNPGNASQEKVDQSSISYDMIYRDPEQWYGGAVTVVNPFCPPK